MRRRYDKSGFLALHPQAFLDLFIEVDDTENEIRGDVEIVNIRGPLEHHEGWWCDSYEAIVDRVASACAGNAKTIVLRVDSPGGDLFGCFDAARSMRAKCAAAGKKLIAYVDGHACSAAYALACAASEIHASETALLGSIGVLATRVDVTAADAAHGIGYALVASGSRKLDGHPHASLSAAELAATQIQVDALAELFFELVASLRGVDAKAIAALNAGTFHGALAVEAGLADRVATFDDVLAAIANGGASMPTEEEREEETPPAASQQDVDDARAALQRAADDGDERAAEALRVLNGGADDEEEEAPPAEGRAASAPATARSARRGGAATTASSGNVSGSTAAELAAEVARLSQRVEAISAEKDNAERSALLSARADIGKPLAELLATKPLAEVKEILDRMPRSGKANPAATAVVGGTRGKTQADKPEGTTQASAHAADLDKQFGLTSNKGGVSQNGQTLKFEVPRREPRTATATPAVAEKGGAK
jgi:capsid assembly protease